MSDNIEKYQNERNILIDISSQIIDIPINFEMGALIDMEIMDEYLIITDLITKKNKGIHILNKNNFKYITSTGIIGRGPGEIVRIGVPHINTNSRIFWVPDYGRMILYKFYLDSVLWDSDYKPWQTIKMQKELFLVNSARFINDSIALGNGMQYIGNNKLIMKPVKLNTISASIKEFSSLHPAAVNKKSYFYCIPNNNLDSYIIAYKYIDLLSIYNIDGSIKYNIYGPGWRSNKNNTKEFYNKAAIYKDCIITDYNGDTGIILNEYKRPVGNNPSRFEVFTMTGDYVLSMETGHKFSDFCVDEKNNRIIVYFDSRKIPLGYFSISEKITKRQ